MADVMPDAPLALLASGITWLTASFVDGKPLLAPYPITWQRGLNLFAAECLQRGVIPPSHTVEALAWCQRPILSWPVSFTLPARLLDQPLLEGEQPTELCRELALSVAPSEAEYEHCENLMQRVRTDAAVRRSQEGYVAFRRYLIENPVVTQESLLIASFQPGLEHFGGELHDMYENVPVHAFQDETLWLCGRCGWTLERKDGRLRCGDDRCRKLTANFTRGTRSLSAKMAEHWLRVRRPIRRYIVIPGIYEVELFRQLQTLHVDTDLWPGFDSYDLRIAFESGETWAADLKDWRYPHLLVRRLDTLPNDGSLRWDRAFYVIPDDRVSDAPGYLTSLQSATEQLDFTVLAISEFLDAVQRKGNVTHG
jgi:hypothetical protein